jgi:hypothetical protein
VGLVCVAIVVVILWMLAGYAGSHESATSGDRFVQATVKASASCQGADTQDSLTFTMDGQTHSAKLDGCGHQPGEQVGVLVPAGLADNGVVEPADAAPGNATGLSHRVAFLLMIVATAVGGGCGYQFFRTRNQGAKATPPGAGRKSKKLGGGKLLGSQRTVGKRTVAKRPFAKRAGDELDVLDEPIAVRSGRFAASGAPVEPESSGSGLTRPSRGRSRTANDDPEATGVDWFEDSVTDMAPVDREEHADKS